MSCMNAKPETVALAVLDASERAVRGCAPDYADFRNEDARFMDQSVQRYMSRLRVLRRQAAAGWQPEFTALLNRCHSIRVSSANLQEKEDLRTKKMKCMACGRLEHRCPYVLDMVGPFNSDAFTSGPTSVLQSAWNEFIDRYETLCDSDFVKSTRRNILPKHDLGQYAIGATCLRKAELYFLINTVILEACYEANISVQEDKTGSEKDSTRWFYALQNNAIGLIEKMRGLELAVADEKRPVPEWNVDENMWRTMDEARRKAAGGDEEKLLELLRSGAEAALTVYKDNKEEKRRLEQEGDEDEDVLGGGEEDEEDEEEDVLGGGEEDEEDEEEDDEEICAIQRNKRSPARQRRVQIQSDDEESVDIVCAPQAAKPKAKRKRAASSEAVRRSSRIKQLAALKVEERVNLVSAPHARSGPHNEVPAERSALSVDLRGSDESGAEGREDEQEARDSTGMVAALGSAGSRRAEPNAFDMAREQRVPGDRLAARRAAMINLGTLQVKLLREGRDTDAAICTTALFVMQELCARNEQLAHTV